MLNNCSFIGRLARTPELKRTQSETAVTSFTLYVDRDRPTKDGEWLSDPLDFVAWRGLAEKICSKFQKGDLIAVTGRLQLREWTDKDGQKRQIAEIQVDTARKLSSPKNAASATPSTSAADEEDQYTELPDEPGELPF